MLPELSCRVVDSMNADWLMETSDYHGSSASNIHLIIWNASAIDVASLEYITLHFTHTHYDMDAFVSLIGTPIREALVAILEEINGFTSSVNQPTVIIRLNCKAYSPLCGLFCIIYRLWKKLYPIVIWNVVKLTDDRFITSKQKLAWNYGNDEVTLPAHCFLSQQTVYCYNVRYSKI